MKNLVLIACNIFVFFFMNDISAQENKSLNFSVQGGVNTSVLDNDFGPSLSFHYTFRTDKTFQLETQIFSNMRFGDAFISRDGIQTTEIGLASGVRVNVLAGKKWNPSIAIMPTFAYVSELNTDTDIAKNGFFAGFNAEISNTINYHHMISIGTHWTASPTMSLYLKYGYCF